MFWVPLISTTLQYLLATVESALADLLSFGLKLSPSTAKDPTNPLRSALSRLCLRLVPESIALTDAFGYTDWELDRYVMNIVATGA